MTFRNDTLMASPLAAAGSPARALQGSPSPASPTRAAISPAAALPYIEEVRLLIIGMEDRMKARKEQLAQEIARAEEESRRFDTVKREVEGMSA